MSQKLDSAITVIGIDIGKNSFHIVAMRKRSPEAVQRPTMKFVATKTAQQLDLQALHRVRERLVSQRTGIVNQIRAFLLERGIAVSQGLRFLQAELPNVLAKRTDLLSPRMLRVIQDLCGD
jgi:transposase